MKEWFYGYIFPLFTILEEVCEMAQKCKLLSLDTSSSKTGWAYFEDTKYKKSGIIDLDTKECKKKYKNNSDNRIKDMCIEVLNLLQKYL